MDEENNNIKKDVKAVVKSLLKIILLLGVAVIVFIFLTGFAYVILQDDFAKVSKENAKYQSKVDSSGKTVITKKVENKTEGERYH